MGEVMAGTTLPAPSVLVVGAGAIGAFYGAVLARQGARVSVVCRSDFATVSRSGFSIRSATLGDQAFRPERVLRDAADCGPSPDYLLLTVKVLEGVDRAALIRPAVGPNTLIVLIQNGIDIESEIASAFPDNEVASGLAFVGVRRVAPGEIVHHAYGSLVMGNFPSGISPAVQQLAALFEAGGIGCKLTENVLTARWQKAVWNAVFNPISILGGVLDTATILATSAGEDFVRQAMAEVCAVAAALGHPLPADTIERNLAGTRAMGAYKTSMALDYENVRAMEVEAILGNAVRAGRRAGVAMPALEALYALTKMVEHKIRLH